MQSYLLRYQAASFDDNVFDAQQLSAVRGASLSYLYSGKLVMDALKEQLKLQPAEIYTGASQGTFAFKAESAEAAKLIQAAVKDKLRQHSDDYGCNKHLAYVVTVVALKEGEETKALQAAESLCNVQKLQQGSFVLPSYDEKAKKPGSRLDPRPALPKGNCSAAMEAREKFGRDQRKNFYKRMSKQDIPFDFTNNLEEMVTDAPGGLPVSLPSKIAVFYADGDNFGQRFKNAAKNGLDNLTGVSGKLKGKQQELLRSILAWLGEHYGPGVTNSYFVDGAARFETLIWGGDENLFVMPSWLGLEFAKLFYEQTKGWKLDDSGKPWTYSGGLVICNHKTPIRQVKAVAKELAERNKNSGGGSIQIEIFESISMPDVDFDAYRRKLYFPGKKPTDDKFKEVDRYLCILGENIGELIQNVVALKKENGLPRSQLYKMLQKVSKEGVAASRAEDKDQELRKDFELWKKRAGADADITEKQVDVLRKLSPSITSPTFSLSLAVAAMLWDYVEPLGVTDEGRPE